MAYKELICSAVILGFNTHVSNTKPRLYSAASAYLEGTVKIINLINNYTNLNIKCFKYPTPLNCKANRTAAVTITNTPH